MLDAVLGVPSIVKTGERELSQVWYRVQEASRRVFAWYVTLKNIVDDREIVQFRKVDMQSSDFACALSHGRVAKNIVQLHDFGLRGQNCDLVKVSSFKLLAGFVKQLVTRQAYVAQDFLPSTLEYHEAYLRQEAGEVEGASRRRGMCCARHGCGL